MGYWLGISWSRLRKTLGLIKGSYCSFRGHFGTSRIHLSFLLTSKGYRLMTIHYLLLKDNKEKVLGVMGHFLTLGTSQFRDIESIKTLLFLNTIKINYSKHLTSRHNKSSFETIFSNSICTSHWISKSIITKSIDDFQLCRKRETLLNPFIH